MVKAWPIRLLAAGAGLHLYDQINNDGGVSKQKVHTSANEWLDGVFKDEYCVFDDKHKNIRSEPSSLDSCVYDNKLLRK